MDRVFVGLLIFLIGFFSFLPFDTIFDFILREETAPLCFFPWLLLFTPIAMYLIFTNKPKETQKSRGDKE